MYLEHLKGSTETIQGYECQIPQVGYGKNRITKQTEFLGVVKRSNTKSEQYWEKLELPDDWEIRRKKEIAKQKIEPDYFDIELEKIRDTHWKYRLCGMWVMINGTATYLPPSFFFYLNYCKLDVGYPDYWETDRKYFYVWEYCKEDARSAGFVDIEGRRSGKTFKSGSIILDETSLNRNFHGGIQSKTSADAKKVFQKAVVQFFKKLPDFFMPVYDQSKGVTPTSELRFFQTTVKGKKSAEIIDAPELESWIDWGSSDIFHFDGNKLNIYVMDEFGKTTEVSVWDRWNVVKYCLINKGSWVGKAILTSTIEDIDTRNVDGKKLWQFSDPTELDKNERTKTGLYRFFIPAYEKTIEINGKKLYDKFGKADHEATRQFFLNERDGLRDDPRALSSAIRKNPFTIEEAFRIDGEKCLYDSELLNDQLDFLSWNKNVTTRGNFVWEGGVRDSKVVWKKDSKGKWEICWMFDGEGESNKISKIGNFFKPENTKKFVGAGDTFSHSIVKDNRRSDGALVIKKKFDASDTSIYNDAFVCLYKYRAASTDIQYEDMLMTAVFFGCQILFESNKNGWKDYFIYRGYEAFLMKLKGYEDYGIPGNQKTHQQLAEATEAYILEDSKKVFFKSMIMDWLEFDINNTTAYDVGMASGYVLIADSKLLYRKETLPLNLSDYGFKKRKIA